MVLSSSPLQLQVWSTHKEVCGPNSAPFRWPRYSEKEAQDILDSLDLRPRDTYGNLKTETTPTVAEAFTRRFKLTREQLEQTIKSLAVGQKSSMTAQREQRLLVELRTWTAPIFAWPATRLRDNDAVYLANNDWARGALSSFYLTRTSLAKAGYPVSYLSTFNHRLVIHEAVVTHACAAVGDDKHVLSRLAQICRLELV
ncbi:hypothetical protein JCM10213_006170 [Rhodosporidiobolus nylandii]